MSLTPILPTLPTTVSSTLQVLSVRDFIFDEDFDTNLNNIIMAKSCVIEKATQVKMIFSTETRTTG